MGKNIKISASVGQRMSGDYAGWYTILCDKGSGIEIMIHPSQAKKLGITDIGSIKLKLEKLSD